MKQRRILPAAALGVAVLAAAAIAQPRRPDPSTMATYVMGIYVRGPEWTAERSARGDSIQAGHMANMGKMAEAGALIGAGPFGADSKYRGLLIFRDMALDSVRALVVKDPAIQTQRLLIELHRWYAPKGIGDAYAARARLRPENPDSMIMVPMAFLSRPSNPPPPDSAAGRVSVGHMTNILDMMTSGQLLAAGPFFDDGPIRGVSFFATDSVTARKLCNDDPAVKSGRTLVEMLPWWTAWGVLPPTSHIKEIGP